MKYIEEKVLKFLNKKLDQGHHELVYGLTSYWGSLNGLGNFRSFYGAAWRTQERLIAEFDYPECPGCYWATSCDCNSLLQCCAQD